MHISSTADHSAHWNGNRCFVTLAEFCQCSQSDSIAVSNNIFVYFVRCFDHEIKTLPAAQQLGNNCRSTQLSISELFLVSLSCNRKTKIDEWEQLYPEFCFIKTQCSDHPEQEGPSTWSNMHSFPIWGLCLSNCAKGLNNWCTRFMIQSFLPHQFCGFPYNYSSSSYSLSEWPFAAFLLYDDKPSISGILPVGWIKSKYLMACRRL